MALSNAEKQARWRLRNQVNLQSDAEDIARQMIDMPDQTKLAEIVGYITEHLANPAKRKRQRQREAREAKGQAKLFAHMEAATGTPNWIIASPCGVIPEFGPGMKVLLAEAKRLGVDKIEMWARVREAYGVVLNEPTGQSEADKEQLRSTMAARVTASTET